MKKGNLIIAAVVVVAMGFLFYVAGCCSKKTPAKVAPPKPIPVVPVAGYEVGIDQTIVAQAVEPDNADIAERVEHVRQLRARGEMTLPSNLALEKRTNPFLRTSETSVKQKADERNGRDNRSGAEVFASLRAWKDTF